MFRRSQKLRPTGGLTPLAKAQALVDAPFESGILAPSNLLGDLYGAAMSNDPRAVPAVMQGYTPYSPSVNREHLTFFQGVRQTAYHAFVQRPAMRRELDSLALQKAVDIESFEAQSRAFQAKEQGNVVNESLSMYGLYNNAQGVVEPTGITFQAERDFVTACEPLGAIVGKRVEQAAMYSVRCLSREKHVSEPGFRVTMTNRDEVPTKADLKRMSEIEQFIEEGGYTEPPDSEKPMGYQPGFEAFMRQFVRDSLTLDWTNIRRWSDTDNPKKYPVVAFCCEDAALIRRMVKEPVAVENGVIEYREFPKERTNTTKSIVLVKVDNDGSSRPLIEFTKDELVTFVRRPRTDEQALGYGYSEIEQAWNAINIWCAARDYNASRFAKDSLPRGLLYIMANMNQQQVDSFTVNWQQMMRGLGNRWNTPIVRATPGAGANVGWTPFDMSSREMEYSQFLFTVGLWMHCIYQIHPDETGFAAASPFRPPLSEASPEQTLKYSQDTGFNPIMRFVAGALNREVVWKLEPSRRYKLEFVGMGDWNEMEHTETQSLKLQTGLMTPRMACEENNTTMPEAIQNHPAFDFPAPFQTGFQLINALAQQMHQQDQQDAAMQQQTQQTNAQQKMMQDHPELAAGSGAPGGGPPGGGPPGGGPPGGGGAPPNPLAGGGMGAPGDGTGMGADALSEGAGGEQPGSGAMPASEPQPGMPDDEDDDEASYAQQMSKAFMLRGTSARRRQQTRYDVDIPPQVFVRGGKRFRN
jgi:hypothetical protein